MRLIIVLLVTYSLAFGQLTQNSYLGTYEELPQAENLLSGTGSFGFGPGSEIYNHKFSSKPGLQLYVGALTSINGDVKNYYSYNDMGEIYHWGETIYQTGRTKVLPEIKLEYTTGDFSFLSLYSSSEIFAVKDNNLYGAINLETGSLLPKNLETDITDRIIQFSAAYRVGDNLSVSGGFATHSLKKGYYRLNAETNFFNRSQFISSINYRFNDCINAYFTYRSPIKGQMAKQIKGNYNYLDFISFVNDAIPVNYPGIAGYGVQFKFLPSFTFSVEAKHQFMEEKYIKRTVLNFVVKFEEAHYDICNNLFAGGICYEPSPNVSLGMQYAWYAKYDNNVYPALRVKNLQFLLFSAGYTYSNFTFDVKWQHSSMDYYLQPENFCCQKMSSNYIKLGLQYNFMIE